jgi:predicted Zn-dependent protease
VLDGDRMDPDWKTHNYLGPGGQEYNAGWQYSVYDADADGRVENPIVDDSAVLDPGKLDPGEYTLEQVQLHTVLHEMGHAVGMSEQHTTDSSCLMYEESINWDRAGHFSPAARSQILIHNN